MSASIYPGHAASGPSSGNYRPATIAELAARAQDNLWDPDKGLKHWLRTAERARRTAEAYVQANDYENAFVEYAKAATIVLEKLPGHREYQTLLNADQRHNLGMNGQDILDSLSQLKPVLVERYEQWLDRENVDPENSRSLPVTPPDISREEAARRRREQQMRAQEEERAQRARDAARREEEWKREDTARREAEERERQAREEPVWSHSPAEIKRREEMAAAAERRASEARALAERERAAHAERTRQDDEMRRSHHDEMRRSHHDEKRRQEHEGIARRHQEAEAAARSARRDIASRVSPVPSTYDPASRSLATPQPSRPPSANQQHPLPEAYRSAALAIMPLESPTKNDEDSSTDIEGVEPRTPWNRSRQDERSPTRNKPPIHPSRISYPPPITTTSPPPPELGVVRYPSLMSQHQLKQGYVPSLQSMFSKPSEPQADSSLLFESKPRNGLYSNILPQPSTPAPVIPPHPSQVDHRYTNGHGRTSSSARGPSPSGARPPPPPRIIQSSSNEPAVRELRTVKLPRECLPRFLSIARVNTSRNRETCGLLLGKDRGNKFLVTTLLIPKQRSTSDTCTMDEEELVLQFTEERHLITLGWIHTHPTQSCFMSSVDLHTHSGFQRMLPESFAVVCAPSSTPTFGIFRLTDPGGLQVILDCTAKEAFHPHPEVPIYTDCDNSHVQMKDTTIEIVDLR